MLTQNIQTRPKYKLTILALLSVAILFSSAFLAGCGDKKEVKDYVGLVIGATANTPKISQLYTNSSSNKFSNMLINDISTLKTDDITEKFKVVNVSPGSTIANTTASLDGLSSYANTPQRKRAELKKNKETIATELDKEEPDYQGADYFNSIIQIADYFVEHQDDAAAETKKTSRKKGLSADIFVLGSGLSDSGVLNFSTGGFISSEETAKDIAETFLDENEDLVANAKSYKGITVYFSGLGIGVAPQPTLSKEQIKKVEDIYTYIFEKLNFSVDTSSIIASKDFASVKTTHTVNITPIGKCDAFELRFGEDKIKFAANSAVQFDPATPGTNVQAILEEVADMAKASNATITIEGYIANPTDAAATDGVLGQGRASTIKSILVDKFGVPAANINAVSGGFGQNPEPSNDEKYLTMNRYVLLKMTPQCAK
jgi:outer membrane protein OmpA-like peptidoglycan-associated protein